MKNRPGDPAVAATTDKPLSPRAAAKAAGETKYPSDRPCPKGHVGWRRTANGSCEICARNLSRELSRTATVDPARRAETLAKWNASPKGRQAKLRWQVRDPKNAWACSATGGAKARAKKAGLPFDIDKEYVRSLVPDVCPVLGTPFVFYGHKLRPDSPSLDRLIPSRGYVRGNVAVISQRANAIKSDASADEIQRVADWLRLQEKS